METVILARHAESEFSIRGAVNGEPAVECRLTPEGREQAARLADELRDEQLDLCVVTEFERTHETADLVLASRDVPRLVLAGLNEIRFGEFEGRPLDDYRDWARANKPTADAPGGGESRAAIVLRYVEAYRVLLERPERAILVVAHGLPIRYVLNALRGEDPAPLVDQVPYALPHRLRAAELRQAVERLERWAARPAWSTAAAPG